jgi:hypothetical protein
LAGRRSKSKEDLTVLKFKPKRKKEWGKDLSPVTLSATNRQLVCAALHADEENVSVSAILREALDLYIREKKLDQKYAQEIQEQEAKARQRKAAVKAFTRGLEAEEAGEVRNARVIREEIELLQAEVAARDRKLAYYEQQKADLRAEIDRLDRELIRAKQEKQVEATANEGRPGSHS